MRKLTKTLALTGVLVTGIATASTLQALDTRGPGNSTVDQGMMNRGGMMDQCGQMMQGMMNNPGSRRPNDQWRRTPSIPGEEKM